MNVGNEYDQKKQRQKKREKKKEKDVHKVLAERLDKNLYFIRWKNIFMRSKKKKKKMCIKY